MAQQLAPSNVPDKTRRQVGISAAALLLGGGAALGLIPQADGSAPGVTESPVGLIPTELPPHADLADGITDAMSFDEAFAAARTDVGPGGVFWWRGQLYNTFWREEWTDLSLAQRQEYAEMVLDVELPVRRNAVPDYARHTATSQLPDEATKPLVIEGYVGQQRVIGIDDDNDGNIDALVIEGEDGYSYRVVDRTGDSGLDSLYQYDAVTDEYRFLHALPQPTLLTTEQLSDQLEDAMSKQIINDVLADTTPSNAAKVDFAGYHDELSVDDGHDGDHDDTYINDGDVDDMDAPNLGHVAE